MIIGFGFGSPLIALLMLLITGFGSYYLFKFFRGSSRRSPNWEDREELKEQRRQYYYEQRRRARELIENYDLSDEEIEEIVEKEIES